MSDERTKKVEEREEVSPSVPEPTWLPAPHPIWEPAHVPESGPAPQVTWQPAKPLDYKWRGAK